MNFSEVDTSSVKPTTFRKVNDVISKIKKDKCGECMPSQEYVEDVFSFQTSGDQANFLGRANIDFRGMVEIKKNCSWCGPYTIHIMGTKHLKECGK